MRIELLNARRDLIPTIADLLHLEWGELEPWSDPASIAARFSEASFAAKFPYCLVATSDTGQFMGTASVKLWELPFHPDKQHWLGEVFVPKPLRGQGIARRLIERIVDHTFASGANALFLYTPDQQEFYQKLGWQPFCLDIVNTEEVTIMVRHRDVDPQF